MTKMLKLISSKRPPKRTEREISQEQTISTMRLLIAALIRKYGTVDTVVLTRRDIEIVKEGDLRVLDDPQGNVRMAIKIGNAGPYLGPKLVMP